MHGKMYFLLLHTWVHIQTNNTWAQGNCQQLSGKCIIVLIEFDDDTKWRRVEILGKLSCKRIHDDWENSGLLGAAGQTYLPWSGLAWSLQIMKITAILWRNWALITVIFLDVPTNVYQNTTRPKKKKDLLKSSVEKINMTPMTT